MLAWIFWRTHSIPSSRMVRVPPSYEHWSKGHSTLLCPCMYMCLLHVDTCTSIHTGKVKLGTPNRAPQNYDLPIWLVADSSSSLVQGRADTVKSITTQFGHWWFIRYKQIYCHYTSNFYHIIGENYSFYSPRSRNSHFHYINPTKYHIFHIYTLYKLFKNIK